MRQSLSIVIVVVLAIARTAAAHPMPSSAVSLRFDPAGIDAELTLPIIELRLGWQQPVPMDPDRAVADFGVALRGYVTDHVKAVAPDGRPWTVTAGEATPVHEQNPDMRITLRLTPPPGAPADRLSLDYDVILHQLVTHSAIVSVTHDWRNGVLGDEPELLGTVSGTLNPGTRKPLEIDRSGGSWWRGTASVFKLGMRHIAEGTDHLLFLLALLLPAPLVARGRRWREAAGVRAAVWRIAGIVTAFTVGHSITLVLGALGWVTLPSAVIESAIAVSIFVSAVHALVPIARGKEIYVAGGFGLVHGLAFASTITAFGFDAVTTVSSIFAFNIGIEVVQLFVIVVTMPWLVLMSRTLAYTPVRIVGATLTAIAAAAWFVERALGWNNPVGPYVEAAAGRAVWIIVGLAVASLLAWQFGRPRPVASDDDPTADPAGVSLSPPAAAP